MNESDKKLLMAIEQAIEKYLSETISIEYLKVSILNALARHTTQ